MKDLSLVLSSLKSRWLNSLLSVFLTAFGVMLALVVIQFSQHVQNRLSADGQGINIVVGAKGSPLQMVLSSVYHIDIPTGNIPYDQAKKLMKHPHVKTAIPLALGDNWKGYRIVGTTPEYMKHYGAELKRGEPWHKAFEAIAGSAVGLNIGDSFVGAHGLIGDGHVHEEEKYLVTGVMKPTGTVLDRLILTSLDSVLNIHGQESVEHAKHESHAHDEHKHHDHKEHKHESHAHENEHHDHKEHKRESHAHEDEQHDHKEHKHESHAHEDKHHDHDHAHDEHKQHDHEKRAAPEITALLLTTKSPIANINLPRKINRGSTLQAANPALELARLTSMLGLGSKSFQALATLLIIIASLSIFSGLAGSLENRMGDLAVLRAIGYSKRRVFKIITLEGMIITVSGTALGVVMGTCGFLMLKSIVPPLQSSGAEISFTSESALILFSVLIAGFVAAMIPAMRAAKVDVAQQVSRNT